MILLQFVDARSSMNLHLTFTLSSKMMHDAKLQKPNFSLNEVRFLFDIESKLSHFLITNNTAFVICGDVVRRFSLDEPSKVLSLRSPRQSPQDTVSGLWANLRATHLIIQVNHSLHFYLHESYTSFKALPKLNGLKIRNITFREDLTNSGVVELVTTTTNDCIFVVNIKPHTSENKRDDKLVKQILRCKSEVVCVCVSTSESRVYVVSKSEVAIYETAEFSQKLLVEVFASQPLILKHTLGDYRSAVKLNEFHVLTDTSAFVSNDQEALLAPNSKWNDMDITELLSFTTTRHHYILIYETDRIVIQDKLLMHPPIELNPNLHGINGVISDPVNETVWVYTDSSIYEIVVTNEHSSIWYGYYIMGRFDEALALLDEEPSNNNLETYKNFVKVKKGYNLLQKGGFGMDISQEENRKVLSELQLRGVRNLACSMEPFEKVCLLLSKAHNHLESRTWHYELLIAYLREKLSLAKKERSKLKAVIIATWTLLLYSQEIAASNDQANLILAREDPRHATSDLIEELKQFLDINQGFLDPELVIEILLKADLDSVRMHYAVIRGEFEYILTFHLENGNWTSAIATLKKAIDSEGSSGRELLYTTAPLLLQICPKVTVDTWAKTSGLQIQRLLPAILDYVRKHDHLPLPENHALNFLAGVIYDSNCETAINAYLALIVRYPDDDQQRATKALLKALNHLRDSKSEATYDKQLILRLAIQHGKLWPAVVIMIEDMQLYETSLKFALKHKDVRSAEYILRKFERNLTESAEYKRQTTSELQMSLSHLSDNDQNMRKRLWLVFAQFVMKHSAGDFMSLQSTYFERHLKNGFPRFEDRIRYLIEYAKETSHFKSPLNVKDLIALLPERVEISQLKEEIVDSLDSHNDSIALLTSEMKELALISSKLREQITTFRDEKRNGQIGVLVEAGEACALCSKLLLEKNIVVFANCQHCYHKDCVARYHLKQRGEYRFKEMFQKFRQQSTPFDREELDQIFLKQCVLCHEVNLSSIDDNIIDIEKDKQQVFEWVL